MRWRGTGEYHAHLVVPRRDAWKKLHERFIVELELVYVQFDELWPDIKNDDQGMWL